MKLLAGFLPELADQVPWGAPWQAFWYGINVVAGRYRHNNFDGLTRPSILRRAHQH
jgi:hypothetical protein